MKGVNTLKLNQQTMCEALQVWLDKALAPGHGQKVTRVNSDGSRTGSYGGGGDEFEVQFTEQLEGVA